MVLLIKPRGTRFEQAYAEKVEVPIAIRGMRKYNANSSRLLSCRKLADTQL
jgi:hypothetical protein